VVGNSQERLAELDSRMKLVIEKEAIMADDSPASRFEELMALPAT
jgi:hypothetical protein